MAQQNKRKIRIPEEVHSFAKMDFKKFKKKNKDYYDSKKELKQSYFSELLYDLADTIVFLVRNSHIQDEKVQEVKNACYCQLSGKKESPAFIKYISKVIKEDGVESIPNIQFFPIILHDIISDINAYNEKVKKENPDAEVFDASELYELDNLILKKKLKKAAKKEIDEDLAFDLLSIIPCNDAMKFSPYFRIKSIFEIMYFHSKTKKIDFKNVIKLLIDEEYYDVIISYALQERKEKFQKFNESQKVFFNDISSWVFDELEEMDKSTIESILKTYVKTRKRDDEANKDGNRRYFISSLPDSMYPKICKIVEKMKKEDSTVEKYL